jgi:NAD(P)-dependent dehydrogenase (short-subunit alcohol dehydrogenase family)
LVTRRPMSERPARARIRNAAPRVVVITGGTRGLGRVLATSFVTAGDSVWCLSRGRSGGPPEGAHWLRADVRNAAVLHAAAARIRERAGPIDVWINNAGGGVPVPFDHRHRRSWQAVFDLNFHGTVNGCRAALRHVRQNRAALINIASLAGLMAPAGHSAYTSAKAAVIALTKSLAVEFAESGVRCNAIVSGPIDTPGFRSTGASPARRARAIPTRTLVHPEEVASACHWLCEPNASVTGHILTIDGGASAAGCYV